MALEQALPFARQGPNFTLEGTARRQVPDALQSYQEQVGGYATGKKEKNKNPILNQLAMLASTSPPCQEGVDDFSGGTALRSSNLNKGQKGIHPNVSRSPARLSHSAHPLHELSFLPDWTFLVQWRPVKLKGSAPSEGVDTPLRQNNQGPSSMTS